MQRWKGSAFFDGDVRSAAESAAFELESHDGLPAEGTDDLAERIEDTIREFFKERST